MHANMSECVFHQNMLSEQFPIIGQTKKNGCILAPMLLSLYLAAMLHKLSSDNLGVDIKCQYDGGFFNLSRLWSHYGLNKASNTCAAHLGTSIWW